MHPNTAPRVSIVVPVYNGSQWIGHALRSVFAQNYRDFEVIVVDDGSTDDLEGALREWSGRIIFARQANGGPASARNNGLSLARGELVAFLDADDEWMPDKLMLQVAYFERYPQTGLLHTAVVNETSGDVDPEMNGAPPRNVFCDLFHTRFFIRTLTVMAPRRFLLEVGAFDERREIHVEDWDLWLRIAARHPVGYLGRPLALHRRGGHMSTAYEKTYAGQALVMNKQRALCQLACASHRAAPEACLRDRQYVLHWSLAHERFRHGNRAGARQEFARARALKPWRLATYGYYAACFVPDAWVSAVRSLRRSVGVWGPDGKGTSPKRERKPPRPTIAHDTMYHRGRRRVTRSFHALDDRLARLRGRRRVLFEAASPMSFGLFQPVYRRLQQDPRIEFWFTARGRAWRPEAIFASVGVTERVIPEDRAIWAHWDLAVNTDFWEMSPLRRCRDRVHVFHGVAGKYGLDAPVDLAREIATFSCLMFPNQDRLQRYVEAGLVASDPRSAALVGYPKADAVLDGTLSREAVLSRVGLAGSRPIVLYAPTWSPYSSLNVMGERIIAALDRAGYEVIVKLHDRSYDRLARGSGGVDWAERLAGYASHPRVRVVRDADATPLLFVADALVTDHSSIGFEYMLLDRPLVVVDCPELIANAHINPDKVRELREAADVVDAAEAVPEAVRAALADPSRHSEARRRIAARLFYDAGSATSRAVSVMYDLLDLAPPTTVPDDRGLVWATTS